MPRRPTIARKTKYAEQLTGTALTLDQFTNKLMPGDNVNIDVELITPIAIEQGQRFAIREGGHTVGAGVITEVTG